MKKLLLTILPAIGILTFLLPSSAQACQANTYLTDFSAGTNGGAVTATLLNSSTWGVSGSSAWAVFGGTNPITFSSTYYEPMTYPTLCTNPWPNTGNLGVSVNVTSNNVSYIGYVIPSNEKASTTETGVWFNTSYPATSIPNIDFNVIYANTNSPLDYVSSGISGNGTSLFVSPEVKCGIASHTYKITIAPNTWYWMTEKYESVDKVGSTSQAEVWQVYDSNLNLLGSTSTPSCYSNTGSKPAIGYVSATAQGYTGLLNYSNYIICISDSCPWPLLPNAPAPPPVTNTGYINYLRGVYKLIGNFVLKL